VEYAILICGYHRSFNVMPEHAREVLAAAAAELEVEANYLSSMAMRLEKLIIMQTRTQEALSDDWPN